MNTSSAPFSPNENDHHEDKPIDLNEVNAHLLDPTSRNRAHDTFSHRSTTTSPAPCDDSEKQYYDKLLADDGRPFCDFHFVEATIAENPKTLKSWLRSTPYPENRIFATQFHD